MSLLEDTKKLMQLIEQAQAIYEERRATQAEPDFYKEVKPFADQMDALADRWEQEAMIFLRKYPQKYVHPMQIEQTADNARRVGAHAYFFQTSKAKFMQSAASAVLVLDTLETALEKTP